MRVLVTGGLGTVGAGLIDELRKRGHGTETVVVRLFNTYGPGEY
jgi:nucleoside-diphosphate-sugar epimerase